MSIYYRVTRGRRAGAFPPRSPRGDGGLLLLEIAVAIGLLTALALAAALICVPVSRQARINREVGLANTEVKRVLEKVHAVPFKKVTTLYRDRQEIPIPSLPSGKIITRYLDPDADPLVLRVEVAWNSADLGPLTRTFSTVRTE